MKKLLLLAFISAFVFVGCKDKETDIDGGDKAPTSYQSKALLEYFSGAWCPYCPDGKKLSGEVKDRVPAGTYTSVVYHNNDQMDNLYDDAIDSKFAAGYPTGMINRIGAKAGSRYTPEINNIQSWAEYNPDLHNLWLRQAKLVQAETALCGLAVDASAKTGSNVDIVVKLGIGAEALPSDDKNYFLTVLVVEEEMSGTGTGWDQRNGYNSATGHAYAGKGDPWYGYVHDNVVRNVLTAPLGDAIPIENTAAGAISTYNFNTDVAGLGEDLKIVAFIHEYTETLTSGTTSYVYNMQQAAVGSNQDWD
jgi:uncharacterized protein (DUF2147 family)